MARVSFLQNIETLLYNKIRDGDKMNRLKELWDKDTLLLQTVYNKIDDLLR